MSAKKASTKKAVAKKKPQQATALHLTDGNDHLIGIKALRVLLSKDGNCWFAQGLDIDYAAAGATLDEAKSNFEQGLALTVSQHLKLHGSIDKFLVVAPQEAWDEFYKTDSECTHLRLTTFQLHQMKQLVEKKNVKAKAIQHSFPFNKLAFIEPQLLAA